MTGPQELREAFGDGAWWASGFKEDALTVGDVKAEALRRYPDPPVPVLDDNRCAICGWKLAKDPFDGCIRGDCSLRPLPYPFYDAKRADEEYGIHAKGLKGYSERHPDPPQGSEAGRWKCTKCGCRLENPWDGGHLVETCHPTWCGPVERMERL
jgi:hypothetical protein